MGFSLFMYILHLQLISNTFNYERMSVLYHPGSHWFAMTSFLNENPIAMNIRSAINVVKVTLM